VEGGKNKEGEKKDRFDGRVGGETLKYSTRLQETNKGVIRKREEQ